MLTRMVEFRGKDLSGSRFDDVDLTEARFEDVDLSRIWMRNVDLSGAVIRGAWITELEIDGALEGSLLVNGVDVVPLVEAELDRRNPERRKLRPVDADGYREAWPVLVQAWAETVERARRLPPDLLHERVLDEWSFVETQRHLVFATDAWVRRALLGDAAPYDPLGLPHTEMGDVPGVPDDPDARPTLDEVLALREHRMGIVGNVIADLTDAQLDGDTVVTGPGYPEAGTYAVRRCLRAVVNEEWAHRTFAERDLAVLEGRA
jgi:uncharacterized protein YjbI with pentapeptide repeats